MILRDIAYSLPSTSLSNDQLDKEHPHWRIEDIAKRSGVVARRIVNKDETALDLAVSACESLFTTHPTLKESVDGIIFCTQTPDHRIPGNATILHDRLGLADNIFAVDINMACCRR